MREGSKGDVMSPLQVNPPFRVTCTSKLLNILSRARHPNLLNVPGQTQSIEIPSLRTKHAYIIAEE